MATNDRAADLLLRSSTAYHVADHYVDSGAIRVAYPTASDESHQAGKFGIQHVRGKLFTFDYHCDLRFEKDGVTFGEAAEYRVHSDLEGLKTTGGSTSDYNGEVHRSAFPGSRREPTRLQDVLFELGSSTEGASCLIPRLLLPNEIHGRPITDLDHSVRSPDELVLDELCWVVSGQQGAYLVDLWIGMTDGLIRRIRRCTHSRERVIVIEIEPRTDPAAAMGG